MGALTLGGLFCPLLSNRQSLGPLRSQTESTEKQDGPSELDIDSGLDLRACLLSPHSLGWQPGGWSLDLANELSAPMLPCPCKRVWVWGMECREMCWLVALYSWDLGMFNAGSQIFFPSYRYEIFGGSSLCSSLSCSS